MYNAVAPKIETSILCFHRCRTMTTNTASTPEIPRASNFQDIPPREYITSMPIMADGKTRPRYRTNFGGVFDSGNRINAPNLVSIVANTTTAMVMTLCHTFCEAIVSSTPFNIRITIHAVFAYLRMCSPVHKHIHRTAFLGGLNVTRYSPIIIF